ncbi:putative motility protein [Hydrogenimonas sp.]
MDNVSMGNGSLMAQVQVDAMKKAMDVQARQVLSVLQGASAMQVPAQPVPPQKVAALTGLGQTLDVRG